MSTRVIVKGKECREALLKGVRDLVGPVGSTLGPSGRAVTIGTRQQNGYYWPHTTKDGARVANSIVLEDGLHSIGGNMVKQAAVETAVIAGDGTSTSSILALALVEAGFALIESGMNPHEVKDLFDKGCSAVVDYLKSISVPAVGEMLHHVALVSANGDETLAKTVFDAYNAINESGVVTLEKGTGNKTRVESVSGMIVPVGTSEFYLTDYRNRRSDFQNPVIAITSEVVSHYKDLESVVKYCTEQKRPLLLFCENILGEAQAFLVGNKGKFPSCVVSLPETTPSYYELLQDLAIVTGAKILGKSHGTVLSKSTMHHYGSCEKSEIHIGRSVIIGGIGAYERVLERVDSIKKQIEEAGSDEEVRDQLQKRLSGIDGGISVIYVGAETEAEYSELYDRYDDAVKAVRSAKIGGVLPGGGIAFLRAMRDINLSGTKVNEGYFIDALSEPFDTILGNAIPELGMKEEAVEIADDRPWIVRKIFGDKSGIATKLTSLDTERDAIRRKVSMSQGNIGYNFRTGQFGDMVEMGIIDPTIVATTALQKAVSVAGAIIMTDHIIINS